MESLFTRFMRYEPWGSRRDGFFVWFLKSDISSSESGLVVKERGEFRKNAHVSVSKKFISVWSE